MYLKMLRIEDVSGTYRDDADKGLKSQLSRYSCDNVIVDGDPSYLNLVKDVFEDATHRRCKWHIPRQVSHLLYMNKEKENSLC